MNPTSPPKAKRILIVEDEGIVAADLEDRLNRMGYHVGGKAASGGGAIEEAAKIRPDLVLMDIILQGPLDGVETAEQITNRYEIPVVFLTAHADDSTTKRAELTGPFGYVVKPFDDRELRMTVEIALYRAAAEKQLRALNAELTKSLAEIKTLCGLLRMCAWCKKIQNEAGDWERLETYLESRWQTEFTHGICRECRAEWEHRAQSGWSPRTPQA
jgi:AmiR/NasT family two-component response regulator